MKTLSALLLIIGTFCLIGCASSDYDWDGTADNWHQKVEDGRNN